MPYAASGLSSRNGLPGVEQRVDPVAGEQLAAVGVLAPGRLGAALAHPRGALAELVDEGRRSPGWVTGVRLAIVNTRRQTVGPPAACAAR